MKEKLADMTPYGRSLDVPVLLFHVYTQSVPITTNVVSSNLVHGEVYSIQNYVIKFVSDLRQVGGFIGVLRFPMKEYLNYAMEKMVIKIPK
jgi:hypothetical protein